MYVEAEEVHTYDEWRGEGVCADSKGVLDGNAISL
jgi:hypothetical protein